VSVDNRTTFPAIAFRQYNRTGDLLGVVAARGSFKLARNGPLVISDVQHPLVMSDTYDGDPHHTVQIAQTDLVPFKPGTDVTFLGAAHTPTGGRLSSWSCGLTVGCLSKRLRVHGPRVWRAKTRKTWKGLIDKDAENALDGWELSEAEPVSYVPLDWSYALGDDGDPNGINPLGPGFPDDESFLEKPVWPAPRIEAEAAPFSGYSTRPVHHVSEGFGPVSPWWHARVQYAGTYDDEWIAQRHPLLPDDFDFRFWQCAHPELISEPWLNGDERFVLENLLPGIPRLEGRLPGIRLGVTIDQGRGPKRGPMVLDGVHFDMRPGIGRVFLTWRTAFPWPERRGLPRLEIYSRQDMTV
jgi:hypothetical protein